MENTPGSQKKKTTSENNKELEKETNKTQYEKYAQKKIYQNQKNEITNICLHNQSKDITKRIFSNTHETKEANNINKYDETNNINKDGETKNINKYDETNNTIKYDETNNIIKDDETNNHRTSSNKKYIKLVGTYGYIAPEIIKGFNYSILSDMWSIGIIFYILMTGITPLPMCLMINYKNTKDILLKKEKKGINFNLLSFHNYPIAKDLCEQLLQFDPNKRISNTVCAANHPWLKYFHILNKTQKNKKNKKKKKKKILCAPLVGYINRMNANVKEKKRTKKRTNTKIKTRKRKIWTTILIVFIMMKW
ncbi:hypothetical protein PFMALIP_03125 [Plasmodium falciparum MaliPS096_E11]|uniref:Protein kinase domain-containing protein n=2 Tax=Plasmodium falciparum TaxID=5833 RepID=A0A024WQK5_PLAFA|nr:hypothetical protein PFMALIP_03125 [Plasmodium falciparum MaliPS096_E11]